MTDAEKCDLCLDCNFATCTGKSELRECPYAVEITGESILCDCCENQYRDCLASI